MSQENHARLIEEYHEAVSGRARLRRILTSVMLAAFVVFGMLLYSNGKTFASSGLKSVHAELSDHLRSNGPHYADSLAHVAGGVATAYKDAALKQLKTDLPKLEKVTEKELGELNNFTQKRWGDFEKELATMSKEQEAIIREELGKIVSEGRAKEIAANYGTELDERIQRFLTSSFTEHLRVGEQIAHNLNRITELEPDINPPLDVNHAIGLTLELAGLEIQDIENN